MVERFVYNTGLVSVVNGASVATFTGAALGGIDREGAQLFAYVGSTTVRIGSIAAVDPRGEYEDLSLPLLRAYEGATITDAPFELVDSIARASAATPAAAYARYASHLEHNMGLVGDLSDAVDYTLVPPNSMFYDGATRTLWRVREGVLEAVEVVSASFNPMGAYDDGTDYSKNDLVTHSGYLYVSGADNNTGNTPDTTPASTSFWTYIPTVGVSAVLAALGINSITVSTDAPSGGANGDLWLRVS